MPASSNGCEELRRCIEECGFQHDRLTCDKLVAIMLELVATETTVEQLKRLFNSAKSSADGKITLLEFVDFLYDGGTQNVAAAAISQAAPNTTTSEPSKASNVASTGNQANFSAQTDEESLIAAKSGHTLKVSSAGDRTTFSMRTEDTDSSATPCRNDLSNIQEDVPASRSPLPTNARPASSDQHLQQSPLLAEDQQGAAAWLMDTLEEERREKHWLAGKYDEVCAEELALRKEISAVRAERDQEAMAAWLLSNLDQERQEKHWLAARFDEACNEERALRHEIATVQAELEKLRR